MPFPILPSNSATGYFLNKSLRFRASASAYLNRTPASSSNRQTWTWSAWVKPSLLTAAYNMSLFGADNGTDTSLIAFTGTINTPTYQMNIYNGNGALIRTTQYFRDPSAWYHIVVVSDTTNATASNRTRLYINGVQVTAFDSATYPSQNATGSINSTTQHDIGKQTGTSRYFDGYMAEVNFVDGQALTPSSFGSTNSLTGVWQPAKYTGTYGTNGFYLPFTNTTSTTTLGYDFSGNSNNWTTNNLSLTAGTTYDSMTDVPTLTNGAISNYCVINPLLKGFGSIGTNYTITNGNLTFNGTAGSGNWCGGDGSIGVTSGKWYYECVYTSADSAGDLVAGWVMTQTPRHPGTGANGGAQADTGIGFYSGGGSIYTQGSGTGSCTSWTLNDVMGLAIDVDAKTAIIYKNGTSIGTASGLNTGTYWAGIGGYQSYVCQLNFGQRPFAYTPPTGFVALNTYNLPTSTIVKGNTVMDATLYTGNGSNPRAITNTAGFQPDFVWLKNRSAGWGHLWQNSVVGASYEMQSNGTGSENYQFQYGYLTSFNSNGFTVTTGSTDDYFTNNSGDNYVGWQWNAGNGSSSSNTAGSITSTVSVNASAGFSVVTYTGNSTNPSTVGHGLGVAPQFIIIKCRSNAYNWVVGSKAIDGFSSGKQLYLNSTSAVAGGENFFSNTQPTSTVFTVKDNYEVNFSGYTYVAYCWTPIAGFSSFGSYTGNGSSDGPFVYTGFRPKFVMIKSSSDAGGWSIFDSVRDSYNQMNKDLEANSADAEYTPGYLKDFVSNGFKIRQSNLGENGNGRTYIYMAFAENPFKNALAR